MLDKIGALDFVSDTLQKVKNISEFIHSDPSVLKFFCDHSHAKELTVLLKNKSATPYLILEKVLTARNALTSMFTSSEWKNMVWASTGEGIRAASLVVDDASFWNNAETVITCTMPLVHALLLSTDTDNPKCGLIYSTLVKTKAIIQRDLNHETSGFKAAWDIIDKIWNAHLRNPLHAAGYFLNPFALHSTDFHFDREVSFGLISSLIPMVKERSAQLEIRKQLDTYICGKDFFLKPNREIISRISPVEWWFRYANQLPVLKSVAIKILSQTCEGASRFRLRRMVAEKVIAGGESPGEQKHLENFEFVHYNLYLLRIKTKADSDVGGAQSSWNYP